MDHSDIGPDKWRPMLQEEFQADQHVAVYERRCVIAASEHLCFLVLCSMIF